jgi:hypoxanthine phosphoribosyltransferase
VVNRKALVVLALTLLAATVAMLFSMYRDEQLQELLVARRDLPSGAAITAAYPDGDLLVLGLLKGSFIFLSDLVRHIARPLQVDFLVASSYGDAMESSGVVRLLYDPETELEGKHILLVEDIVDSGRTLNRLVELLGDRKPRSLEICALLHKHIATELHHPTRFIGFDAPHEFLVGYGLDHAENRPEQTQKW